MNESEDKGDSLRPATKKPSSRRDPFRKPPQHEEDDEVLGLTEAEADDENEP